MRCCISWHCYNGVLLCMIMVCFKLCPENRIWMDCRQSWKHSVRIADNATEIQTNTECCCCSSLLANNLYCVMSYCWLLDFVLAIAVQTTQLLRWIKSQPDIVSTAVLCNIFSVIQWYFYKMKFTVTYCDLGIHHRLNAHILHHSRKLSSLSKQVNLNLAICTVSLVTDWLYRLVQGSGVPRGRVWGVQTPPPEIPKFWQSWAEFPVPWKIHP